MTSPPPFRRSPEEPPFTPAGGPPDVPPPSPEIFKAMGRENIFRMCEDFYFALGKTDIRPMFPEDLREASHKLAAYLVFRLGGPPLYQELHGPPRLRARHLSFQIDERSRRTWLAAFQTILAEADQKYGFPKEHRESFWRFLEAFSGWMVNTKQPGDLT